MSKRGGGKFTTAGNLEQQRRVQSAPVPTWSLQWTSPTPSPSSLPGTSTNQGLKVRKYVKTTQRATFESLLGGVEVVDAMDVDLEEMGEEEGEEGPEEGEGEDAAEGEGEELSGEKKEGEQAAEVPESGTAMQIEPHAIPTPIADAPAESTTPTTSARPAVASQPDSSTPTAFLEPITNGDIAMADPFPAVQPTEATPDALESSSRIPADLDSINIPSPTDPIPVDDLAAADPAADNEGHTNVHIPANAVQGSIASADNFQFGGLAEAGEMEIVTGEGSAEEDVLPMGVSATAGGMMDATGAAEEGGDGGQMQVEASVFDQAEGDGEGGEKVNVNDESRERVEGEGDGGLLGVGPTAGDGLIM